MRTLVGSASFNVCAGDGYQENEGACEPGPCVCDGGHAALVRPSSNHVRGDDVPHACERDGARLARGYGYAHGAL